VIRRVGIASGQPVLEVGCGSGVFLRAAADHAARVDGIDASESLLQLARARVPQADLSLGDMQFLPYENDSFDLVAGFNSFLFAADMVAALREAARVARPGAPVVIQVWGRPERSHLEAMKHALGAFLPPPDPDAPRGSDLWQPGKLERLAAEAGLATESAFDVSWPYEFSDEQDLTDALMSAGGISVMIGAEREPEARAALVDALAQYREPDGSYRLENEWHCLVTRAA
jgi:SAM-dependent methyltransferase